MGKVSIEVIWTEKQFYRPFWDSLQRTRAAW